MTCCQQKEQHCEMICFEQTEQPVLGGLATVVEGGIATVADGSTVDWKAKLVQDVRAAMHEELSVLQVALVKDFRQALIERSAVEESRRQDGPSLHGQSSQTEAASGEVDFIGRCVVQVRTAEDAAPSQERMTLQTAAQVGKSSSCDQPRVETDPKSEKEAMIEPKDRSHVTTMARSTVPARTMDMKEREALHAFKTWLTNQLTPPPSFRRRKRQQTRMIKFVESPKFQWTCAAVMIANFFYLGWYADWTVTNEGKRLDGGKAEAGIWLVQTIFEVWFLFECGLRVVAYRIKYVLGENGIANFFDLLVVVTPSVQLIIQLMRSDRNELDENGTMGFRVPGLSILRSLRILRVAYTFELFRLPLFAEFRMIVNSLIKAMPAFIWVSILALFCIYVQAVCCLLGVASKLQELNHNKPSDVGMSRQLRETWASIWDSLLQVFMSITGGVDWVVTWQAIAPLNVYFKTLFILWMIFMCFACLNTISGMFIERAVRTVNSDRDFWIIEEARQHRLYADRLMGLFHRLDLDHNSSLTWEEFDQHLSNPHIAAYFSWLGVDISNAHEVFKLIDADGDGKITVREFLEGCIDLKGPATNVAMRSLRNTVDRLQQTMLQSDGGSSFLPFGGSQDSAKRTRSSPQEPVISRSSTTCTDTVKQYRRGYFTEEYLVEVEHSESRDRAMTA